jgi:hypothetical protein
MKKLIFTTILLTASFGFATGAPTPAPKPSIQGTWQLTARACTSNALINDGLKLGPDSVFVTNNNDSSFQYKITVGGCETLVTGTYAVDGMKVTYTSASSKSCKDVNPVPMADTRSVFYAYLSDKEAVTVTTGDKAAMSCPAGDALIMQFIKMTP